MSEFVFIQTSYTLSHTRNTETINTKILVNPSSTAPREFVPLLVMTEENFLCRSLFKNHCK